MQGYNFPKDKNSRGAGAKRLAGKPVEELYLHHSVSLPTDNRQVQNRRSLKRKRPEATRVEASTTTVAENCTTTKRIKLDNIEDKPTCGICFEVIEEQGKLDSCDHAFCFSCINTWLARSSTCPHCKAGVTRIIHMNSTSVKVGVHKISPKELRETLQEEEEIVLQRNNMFLVFEHYSSNTNIRARLVSRTPGEVGVTAGASSATSNRNIPTLSTSNVVMARSFADPNTFGFAGGRNEIISARTVTGQPSSHYRGTFLSQHSGLRLIPVPNDNTRARLWGNQVCFCYLTGSLCGSCIQPSPYFLSSSPVPYRGQMFPFMPSWSTRYHLTAQCIPMSRTGIAVTIPGGHSHAASIVPETACLQFPPFRSFAETYL